jgi:hypothetical protein
LLVQQSPEVRKRKKGSRGSSIRRPHSNGFKARVLTAWENKERHSKHTTDTQVANRYSIHKSMLRKIQEAPGCR